MTEHAPPPEADPLVDALHGLSSGPELPPGSEDRTVSTLRAAGMLAGPGAGTDSHRSEPRPRGADRARPSGRSRAAGPGPEGRRPRSPTLATAATAAGALFLGLLVGSTILPSSLEPATPADAARPAPTHVLLLLGNLEDGSDEGARVEEYRTWATDLARRGRLASGEKLSAEAWLLADRSVALSGSEAHGASPVSGFFLLTVDRVEEALAIARSCPHLGHGGQVLVRPIDPT